MTKWICDKKGCGCAPCRCEMQGSFEPVYCILKDDKTFPKWEMYDTETKYEHVERRMEQKPETELPDWCKVGEWVFAVCYFSGNGDYCKIREIKPGVDTILEIEGHGADFLVFGNHIKQARLRPYNAEEMKALVRKVLEHDGNASLVIVYLENGLLRVGTKWVSAERLIEDGYTIDGKPCGKLEHLNDAGEWVE